MDVAEITDKAIDYMLPQLADERRLDKWEQGFIESIADQWTRNRFLSIAQKEKLGKIWDKC